MANVKVKFRKSTVDGRPGTIYYQICHKNSHVNINTSIHPYPEEWIEKMANGETPTTSYSYNQNIQHDIAMLRDIIDEFEEEMEPYEASDVAHRYSMAFSNVKVIDYMRKQISLLEDMRKYGTAENYRCTLKSFDMFLGHHDISFSIITGVLLKKYSAWLESRNVKRNSISFYMRVLRAVYNRAVKEKIIKQTNPFKDVYTGVEHTAKRAVTEEKIIKLFKLNLDSSPALQLSRDMFLFSYCTRGMSFVDIAFLKKYNIRNMVLTYKRRKTGQEISVYIEPCIESIINKYKYKTIDSDYIFPIITENDEQKALHQYRTALNYHNRKLKRLAAMSGINTSLSSYTSRHSWATTARNHNIPLSVISAGMGHTSEKTTEIYLASLQSSVIDEANKNVLKELNMYTSC